MNWTFIDSGFVSNLDGSTVTQTNTSEVLWRDFESESTYSIIDHNNFTFYWKFTYPNKNFRVGINTGSDVIWMETVNDIANEYAVYVNSVFDSYYNSTTIDTDIFSWDYDGRTLLLYRDHIPIWGASFSSSSIKIIGSVLLDGEINSFYISRFGDGSGISGTSGTSGSSGVSGYDGHLNYGTDTYHRESAIVESGFTDYSSHPGVISSAEYRNKDRDFYPNYAGYSGSVIDVPGIIVAAKNEIKLHTEEARLNPNVTPPTDDVNSLNNVFTRYGLNKFSQNDQKIAIKLMQFEASNIADKMMTGQMLRILEPIDYALARSTYISTFKAGQKLEYGQLVGIEQMDRKMVFLASAANYIVNDDWCYAQPADGICINDCEMGGTATVLLFGFFTSKVDNIYALGVKYYLSRTPGDVVEKYNWLPELDNFDDYSIFDYLLQDVATAISSNTLFFSPHPAIILHPEYQSNVEV